MEGLMELFKDIGHDFMTSICVRYEEDIHFNGNQLFVLKLAELVEKKVKNLAQF